VTCDGDVEANPGPTQDESHAFSLFMANFSDGFASLLGPVHLQRRMIQFKMVLLQRQISTESLCQQLSVDLVELDVLLRHVAIFENYATVQLTWTAEGVGWLAIAAASCESEELKCLREELERLKLQVQNQPKSPFLPLSLESVPKFAQESGRAKWMVRMTDIFLEALVDIGEKPLLDSYSEKIWDVVVSSFVDNKSKWAYSNAPMSATASPNSWDTPPPRAASGCRGGPSMSSSQSSAHHGGTIPRTLYELLKRGGVVKSELTPEGTLPFAHLQGRKFYIAKRTQTLWDVTADPPGACHSCGGLHWYWQCKSDNTPPSP
jgi:hypothetical protein